MKQIENVKMRDRSSHNSGEKRGVSVTEKQTAGH
jgi:hypothetical protein